MNRKKILKRVLIGIICLLVIAGAGFGMYVSAGYQADDTATGYLQDDTGLMMEDKWISLESENSETGFIFYPGAKVEYTSYLPLMEKLEAKGISCFLVEMPFNLAFFGSNRAEAVMAAHPEITTWYMGGHSLGGAFACNYASKHQDEIAGVVLLGAYTYGGYPVERTLTIYGSEDLVLNRDKITYDENVCIIDGGNHAGFGNYGEQKGDGIADITAEEQQIQTVVLMDNFIQ